MYWSVYVRNTQKCTFLKLQVTFYLYVKKLKITEDEIKSNIKPFWETSLLQKMEAPSWGVFHETRKNLDIYDILFWRNTKNKLICIWDIVNVVADLVILKKKNTL